MKSIMAIILVFTIALNGKSNIEKSGDIIQILVPLSAYASTFYINDNEGRNQFYKSFISTVLATHILKFTVKEKRPDGSNTQSFPSGHTSAAFQGASFIHERYGFKNAIIPYIAASYVGYTRVYSKKHYTHDVIAGALIGIYANKYFTTRYKNIKIKAISYFKNNTAMYGIKAIF